MDNTPIHPENYQSVAPETTDGGMKLLGAKEKKYDPRNLMMMDFMGAATSPPPELYDWQKRYKRPFLPYHTQRWGSCTISSQAEALRVWARREQFGRDLFIPEADIDKRYFDLTALLYGGGDQGAYELDALKDFRTNGFAAYKGRVHKIEAFTEVPIDKELIKLGLWTFRGVKICYAVTRTMYNSNPGDVVDDDASPIVGYHSMYAPGYDTQGIWNAHTWNRPPQLFTWRYVQNRCTEVYTCIDAKDIRVQQAVDLKKLRASVREAVNTAPTTATPTE